MTTPRFVRNSLATAIAYSVDYVCIILRFAINVKSYVHRCYGSVFAGILGHSDAECCGECACMFLNFTVSHFHPLTLLYKYTH